MPLKKLSNNKYQWGNQKIYKGKDAKQKAIKQGQAIKISESKKKLNKL